jgi:hypothetical protein
LNHCFTYSQHGTDQHGRGRLSTYSTAQTFDRTAYLNKRLAANADTAIPRSSSATDPNRYASLPLPVSKRLNRPNRDWFAILEKVPDRRTSRIGHLMEIRYYFDPDTGQPHIYGHGVTEQEIEEVLRGRGEDLRATGNSRRKIGQTSAGRYLQVFYVPDPDSDSVFVITAYEPQAKAKKAFRRRQRRRPK